MAFWDGTFTDWGTAVGTLGLAAITAWVAWRESAERKILRNERDAANERADRLEREKAERDARIARRQLAEAVSCHLDRMQADPETTVAYPGDAPNRPGVWVDCAVIRNLSYLPITQVEILWQRADAGDNLTSVVPSGAIPVVPPGSMRAMRKPTSMFEWQRSQMRIMIRFKDGNGLQWARRDDGALFNVRPDGSLGERELTP